VVLWSRGEEVTDGKKAHPRPAPKRRALAMCTFTSTTMLRCGRPSMLRPCVSAFCSSCQRMKEIPKEWYPPLHQPKRRNGQSSDDRRLMRVVGRKL
jgi:hypothetical protein